MGISLRDIINRKIHIIYF